MEVCSSCLRIVPDTGSACPHCGSAADAAAPPAPAAVDAAAPPAAAASSGLARRDVMMIALAVVGGGMMTLAALTSRGAASVTEPAGAGSNATVGAAAAVPSAPPRAAGWVENGRMWMGNARKGLALELAARNDTPVWMRTVRPLLVVRCVDQRTDVFVYTDSAAAMEAQDEDHTVRISLDGAESRTERWPDSSAHDALFAPRGAQMLDELSRARTLSFTYTPHNAVPVVAHFDLAGLQERLAPAQRACRP